LVAFNNDVTIIGDGMTEHEIITGDKLSNLETLKNIGSNYDVAHNIGTSGEKLSEAVFKLKENGQTALGPALAVSIAVASRTRGSHVILCTDGLANIGVGSFDSLSVEQEEIVSKWYENLGSYAVQHGVTVNVISITDDGCRLENLGKLTDVTNGYLRRIDPLKLTEKFSGIVDKPVIATQCQAKMVLHPGLQFCSILDEGREKEKVDLPDKKEELHHLHQLKDVGNVFEDTQIFFEFKVQKDRIDLYKDLKSLPFQVQINYTKTDGTQMLRVITQTKPIVFNKKEAKNNLNVELLSQHATRVTTELCLQGKYEQSRAVTHAHTVFLHRNVKNEEDLKNVGQYINDNVGLDHAMFKQQKAEKEKEKVNEVDNALPLLLPPELLPPPEPATEEEKQKARSRARNDKFSSYLYYMKK